MCQSIQVSLARSHARWVAGECGGELGAPFFAIDLQGDDGVGVGLDTAKVLEVRRGDLNALVVLVQPAAGVQGERWLNRARVCVCVREMVARTREEGSVAEV